MIRPKNKTEDLLLSITKNCETLIEQTHKKAEGTLEFKLTKSRKTCHFKPPIQVKGDWMIGLISLEACNSIFNITEENNIFQLYTNPFDCEFSFTELKDKVAEVLGLSYFLTEDVEHELFGPNITKTYRNLSIENNQTDGHFILFLKFMQSSFRVFESYVRNSSPLDANDIQLILKQYNSKFIAHKIPSGAYTFKNVSEVLSRRFKNGFAIENLPRNHEHDKSDSIIIESDNVSLITKLILRLGLISWF